MDQCHSNQFYIYADLCSDLKYDEVVGHPQPCKGLSHCFAHYDLNLHDLYMHFLK